MANSTKKRKDHLGHVLKTGESEDKDHRYHFKTMVVGRRYTVSAGSLSELREKEATLKKDLEDGIDGRKGAKTTLNQYFEEYISCKTNIKASTLVLYKDTWDRLVKDSIGQKPVSEIGVSNLRRYYSDCVSGKLVINKEQKRALSDSTLRIIHVLISSALELAADDDSIRKNPSRKAISGIKGSVKERDPLTGEQEQRLLNFLKEENSQYYPMILFMFSTGARGSEVCGIRKADVDMKHSVVSINKQLSYRMREDGHFDYRITSTKTESANRNIPLTNTAKRAIALQKEMDICLGRNAKRQEVCGYSDWLFVNASGKPFTVNYIDTALRRICKRYNETVPEDKQLPLISGHILRHSCATRLNENGLDGKTLQRVLGHSRITTTLDTYVKPDEESVQKQMQEIGNKLRLA